MKEAYNRIPETLPPHILQQYGFLAKKDAVVQIHVPKNQQLLQKARFRMKFDEFFFMQLRLLMQKKVRLEKFKGQLLQKTDLLTEFYQSHLAI